ncbi:MAG: hypothetical protein K6D97_08875 [Clostridia bacterium]|nr:hypothetical protein [Clostridia bacterium]
MFQNIDFNNNVTNNTNSEYDRGEHIKEILKDIFSIPNILIYIIVFLISSKVSSFQFALLSISLFAACVSSGIPLIGVAFFASLGTIYGQGLGGFLTFIFTSIIFLILTYVFKPQVAMTDRAEGIKLGSRLFWSSLIILMAKDLGKINFWHNLFLSCIDSAIIYVYYKIFVNGISVFKDIMDKKVFSSSEVLSAVFMLALAFATNITTFSLGGLSLYISQSLIAFLLMLIGLKQSPKIAILSGLIIGLAVMSVNAMWIFIIIYMACGLGAGLFSKFLKNGVGNKILTFVGFILAMSVTSYILTRNTVNPNIFLGFSFPSILLALGLLLLVPSDANIKLSDLIGNTKLISDFRDNRLKSVNKNNGGLEELDELFVPMFDDTEFEKAMEQVREDTYVQNFLDNLENCPTNLLYEELSSNDTIARAAYVVLKAENTIANQDVLQILLDNNIFIVVRDSAVKEDLEEIVKVLNRTYIDLKLEENK